MSAHCSIGSFTTAGLSFHRHCRQLLVVVLVVASVCAAAVRVMARGGGAAIVVAAWACGVSRSYKLDIARVEYLTDVVNSGPPDHLYCVPSLTHANRGS